MEPLKILNHHFYDRIQERAWLKKCKSLFKAASQNIIKSWKSNNTGRIMIKFRSLQGKTKILILSDQFKPVTLLDWDMTSVGTLIKYQYKQYELTQEEKDLIWIWLVMDLKEYRKLLWWWQIKSNIIFI